jgi:hypothetical protein
VGGCGKITVRRVSGKMDYISNRIKRLDEQCRPAPELEWVDKPPAPDKEEEALLNATSKSRSPRNSRSVKAKKEIMAARRQRLIEMGKEVGKTISFSSNGMASMDGGDSYFHYKKMHNRLSGLKRRMKDE